MTVPVYLYVCRWLNPDEPQSRPWRSAPTRNEIKYAAFESAVGRGVEEDLARRIAADAATWIAEQYIERVPDIAEQSLEKPEGALEGRDRLRALRSLAGSIRGQGCSAEVILPSLLAFNGLACYPPLPESDVLNVATSYARMSARRPYPGAAAA